MFKSTDSKSRPDIRGIKLRSDSGNYARNLIDTVFEIEKPILLKLNNADRGNYRSAAREALSSANREYYRHMESGFYAYKLGFASGKVNVAILGRATEEFMTAAYISRDLALGRDKVVGAATQAYDIFVNLSNIGSGVRLENAPKLLEIALFIAIEFNLGKDKIKFVDNMIRDLKSV